MAVILPSTYTQGTATVAANGVTVTGQGTLWLNSILPGDFFGTHKGSPNRVASVNSNTSITLAYPWLGGAQTAAAYEIMFQGDVARVQETTRQLLEKLSNGNVDAFAGLNGAAGRVPVFTGAGTMSYINWGTKGAQVLAAADLVALLARLGPAGGLAPQPSNAEVGMTNGDFNTLIYPGAYTIGSAYINGPIAAASTSYSGICEVKARQGGVGIFQRFTNTSLTPVTWARSSTTTDGSNWSEWRVTDTFTLGAVNRNSANEPIGAIIERGSNANGEYVRYADGTQICWKAAAFVSGAVENATGSVWLNSTGTLVWTYPVAFGASATTIGAITSCASSSRWGTVISATNTVLNARVYSSTSSASSLSCDCYAIGRWYN